MYKAGGVADCRSEELQEEPGLTDHSPEARRFVNLEIVHCRKQRKDI